MSYTPTTWTTGDTITATKLNKIEQGIASAGGGVSGLCTVTNGTMDKSYNDIMSIVNAGTLPFYIRDSDKAVFVFSMDETSGNDYAVDFFSTGVNDGVIFVSSDADEALVLD